MVRPSAGSTSQESGMELIHERKQGLNSTTDFRTRATFGVALAALCLLLPIAILHFVQGDVVTGIGCSGIVIMLSINVCLVYTGRCHQTLTAYCLVPAGMLFMITVFNDNGIIGSLWCFPAIIGCYCMLSARRAWLANFFILGIALPMASMTLPTEYLIRVSATLLAVSVFSAVLVSAIDALSRQLQYQVNHDPLTGLRNRQTLRECLAEAIDKHSAQNSTASLLAIDIDHFKRINDDFGHDTGDQALVQLAGVMKTKLRANDRAFRTGGEEFLILLNKTDARCAQTIAERLRREIENTLILPDKKTLTISVGVALYLPDETWAEWMKRADNNLYEAKRKGRNRVTLASHKLAAVDKRSNKIRQFPGNRNIAVL